jgi:hypothetical protein
VRFEILKGIYLITVFNFFRENVFLHLVFDFFLEVILKIFSGRGDGRKLIKKHITTEVVVIVLELVPIIFKESI